MDSRATQQCDMCPYVYAAYWLPPASSGFLLARKRNRLAEKMLITCVMRNAWAHKIQWSGSTVHSFTMILFSTVTPDSHSTILFNVVILHAVAM